MKLKIRRLIHKFLVRLLILAFLVSDVPAYAQGVIQLPAPGTRLALSTAFAPPLLKGIKVYQNDPFRFDFILDKGDATATDEQVKTDSNRLIKYFLASLTVPEKDLWVNLSPYEKDRIVPEAFGQTGMGRDLLAQDYILKQITASVIYPEGEVGKAFWAKVYAEAQKRYGTTDVPVDTFNKVWIIPEKATVYENKDATFVVESGLKVMLEEDYLALEKNTPVKEQATPATNKLGSEIVREVVIPVLEKEVNEGKNFAPLRQVYYSLILATWYKRKVKASILGQAYVDKQKTGGIDIADKNEKEKIWQQYVEAFKKGAYNLIKEEYDATTQSTIPRKYFSGGTNLAMAGIFKVVGANSAQLPTIISERASVIQMRADMAMDSAIIESTAKTPLPDEFGLKIVMLAKTKTESELGDIIPEAVAVRLTNPEKGISPQDRELLQETVKPLEARTHLQFGGTKKPLLFAVRSSPVQSKPGLFSTVLYIGFTQKTLDYYISSGQSEFGFETYAYFLQSYVKAVIGKDEKDCEDFFSAKQTDDTWETYAKGLEQLLKNKYQVTIPADAYDQLSAAIVAVQGKMHGYGMEGGVLLHEMVYPHMDNQSGSGVLMTVDVKTGDDKISGRFGYKVQGPDIVTGQEGVPIDDNFPYLPELQRIRERLERIYKSVVYIEFVIEQGKVRLLQVRAMKSLPIQYQFPVWKRLHDANLMTNEELLQAMMQAIDLRGNADVEGMLLKYQKGMSLPLDVPVLLYAESLAQEDIFKWISEGRLAGVITPENNEFHHAAVAALTTNTPMFFDYKPEIGLVLNRPVVISAKTGEIKLLTDRKLQSPTGSNRTNQYSRYANKVTLETEKLSLEEMSRLHGKHLEEAVYFIKAAFAGNDSAKRAKDQRVSFLQTAQRENLLAHFVHETIKEREQGVHEIVLYSKEINILEENPQTILNKDLQVEPWVFNVRRQVFENEEIEQLKKKYGDALQIRVLIHSQQYGRRDIEQWNTRYYNFLRVQAFIKQKGTVLFDVKFPVGLGSDNTYDENNVDTLPLNSSMQITLASAKAIQENNPGSILSNYVTIDGIHDGGITSYTRIINVKKFDAAQSTLENPSLESPGGIDFNPDKLNLNTSGKAVAFNIDPAMLQRMQNAPGLNPIIVGVHPLDSLPAFLGASSE